MIKGTEWFMRDRFPSEANRTFDFSFPFYYDKYGYYGIVQATNDLLDRQLKANPESCDLRGRLAPGCFPARIPSKAADLHGQMRRAQCKLAMIRSHAECRHCT